MTLIDMLKTKTNSTLFLTRAINLSTKELGEYGFINAYIDDKNHDPHYPYALYLLFKPHEDKLEDFNYFLAQEIEKEAIDILEEYDYDGGYVVLVYKFPQEFKEEYDLFIQGKYSKFKKEYIRRFPIYGGVVERGKKLYSLQYMVFTKDEGMKEYWEKLIGEPIPEEMEYWSQPNIERETLDINKII